MLRRQRGIGRSGTEDGSPLLSGKGVNRNGRMSVASEWGIDGTEWSDSVMKWKQCGGGHAE
ncbi:hypothetical protein ACLMAB_07290 [Brevibacillus laterosporus]